VQSGQSAVDEDIFAEDVSLEEAMHRLATRHAELAREVALLRTIVLRLVSEPVDRSFDEPAAS